MRFYFHRTPKWFEKLGPGYTWRIPAKQEVFLTFDDGPDPIATPYVLDVLQQYNARATFFVVGENVRKYPEITRSIIEHGHTLGNHSQHHLSGWKTSLLAYLEDIELCRQTLKAFDIDNGLFRPPYGQVLPQQGHQVLTSHLLVMWTLLSGDFDRKLNVNSAKEALFKSKPGDIIVFHDNPKYLQNLKALLPETMETLHQRGLKFAALNPKK